MRKRNIINKIYKILPVYEEQDIETYHKYLSRVIIELAGEEQVPVIVDTIVALRGLANENILVTHSDVRSIVMFYINRIDHEL